MADAPQQLPTENKAVTPERAPFIRQVVIIVIWLMFSGVSIYFLIRIFRPK